MEASFDLSDSSRLPKWVELPQGFDRADLVVTMDYYSTFSGGKYVFKVQSKGGLFNLQKNVVYIKDQPEAVTRELSIPPSGFTDGYPAFNVFKINGVTDIVERRQMEPYFYMSDDEAVWEEFTGL